ncbi:MAG: 1-acyl-sn-glycerol-3-phosphate acyltransferase [Deltaproteobacteria bacterium]|nr:1-acyl-sn-glycerol-3-phosphate acyltransferase [Deltaproteobacteria bacterium]
MRKLFTLRFRSIVLFLHLLFWTPMGMAAALIYPTGRLFMWVAGELWSKQALWIASLRVTVKGLENIDPQKTYIICANHLSLIDIPLLFAVLPFRVRFLAKRGLFYIPIFGWSLYIAGFIPVDRGITSKARRSIERGARRIKRGPSLIVFPEGTRSSIDGVNRFKSGAFTMAIRSSVPVLPVAIRGTFDVVPKTSLKVVPGPVNVIIGEPISTDMLKMKDKESLRKETQSAVEAMFESNEPRAEAIPCRLRKFCS